MKFLGLGTEWMILEELKKEEPKEEAHRALTEVFLYNTQKFRLFIMYKLYNINNL